MSSRSGWAASPGCRCSRCAASPRAAPAIGPWHKGPTALPGECVQADSVVGLRLRSSRAAVLALRPGRYRSGREVRAMPWLAPAEVATAVAAATRAPSMHNSQPWRFRVRSDQIEVLIDPERQLTVADAGGWASRIACGCALFNLRLALAAQGTPAAYRLLPDPGEPLLVARLTPEQRRAPTPVEQRLYAAIPRRHSNRTPFVERDRKSTRLNSSHGSISYAVFCLKKT